MPDQVRHDKPVRINVPVYNHGDHEDDHHRGFPLIWPEDGFPPWLCEKSRTRANRCRQDPFEKEYPAVISSRSDYS